MFNLVMHWINRPLRRAKVDEQLSWWSVGQTCYQVPLSTIDKLVLDMGKRAPIYRAGKASALS
jgi:hypothetical protein